MRKFIIATVIVMITGLLSVAIASASNSSPRGNLDNTFENFSYIESRMLSSSRYTQPTKIDEDRLNNFHNKFTFKPDQAYFDTLGYEAYPGLEDDHIKVYVEKDSFSFIVHDKTNDYYFSSRPEFQGLSGEREDNVRNRNLMNSGIWVEHVKTDNATKATITNDSLYSLAGVSYETDGSITDEQNDPLSPYYLQSGSYKKTRVSVNVGNKSSQTVVFSVDLKVIDFKFDVEVSVDGGSLSFRVPQESIVEDTTKTTVLSISVLPFFGSTRETNVPGYLVIPDGVGALIRLDKDYNTTYSARIYGHDLGYIGSSARLSVPMYGFIHEEHKSGYYAEVEEGEEQAIFQATLYGEKTYYNRASVKYLLRDLYYRVINRAGNGADAISDHRVSGSYKINYHFLQDNASYVGIGNHYKDLLLEKEILNKVEMKDDIDLLITFLMSDSEPTLFGSKRIVMTSATQAKRIYEALRESGIKNQTVNLYGYSHGGASSGLNSMTLFGKDKAYHNLSKELKEDGNQLYLQQSYAVAYNNPSRLNHQRDVAKNTSKQKMTRTFGRYQSNIQTRISYLYPEQSFYKARKDQPFLKRLGAGLFIDDIGELLYTVYDGGFKDREVAKVYYEDIAALPDNLLLSSPNMYLWKHLSGYMNMSITNSQFIYFTDLVPLIPIILQGIMPTYTPYLNFNAMGIERFLQMIDFNLYPSYILTHEDTFKMRYTRSNDYFSTEYKHYEDEIIHTYEYLNEALKHIKDASLESREVLDLGFVKNTYSNGVVIYVNYTTKPKIAGTLTIDRLSYEVVL